MAKPASRPYAKSYSIAQTRSLKVIQSRHMPIGKELEAYLGDAVGLFDYWRVLELPGNERSGGETKIAEKIVLEYSHFAAHFTSSGRLAGTGKGRTTSPLHWLSLPSAPTNLSPTHSRRLATLVAQPVTITLPLVSKISRATVSVNVSPSILTSMARVSLCVCIQTPAELKMKASVTVL